MTEPVKVVFWDLDGTLWSGTLEEDEAGDLVPLPHVRGTMDLLDSRGILNSVVTQASQAAAERRLGEAGLLPYFVSPRYAVGSKAAAISDILGHLNLLPSNAAFVDDLPFHRAEVSRLLPGVWCLDPSELPDSLGSERFASTGMGRERRKMYEEEGNRKKAEVSFSGDRTAFLVSCRMELECGLAVPGSPEEARALELFGRAHRMASTPVDPSAEPGKPDSGPLLQASLADAFGHYGIVAAARMDDGPDGPVCTRLALSCRVQGRGVLEAFLSWVWAWCRGKGFDSYRILASTASDVNAPLRTALRFNGFAPDGKGDGWELLGLVKPERLKVPEWMAIRTESGMLEDK